MKKLLCKASFSLMVLAAVPWAAMAAVWAAGFEWILLMMMPASLISFSAVLLSSIISIAATFAGTEASGA